MVTRTTKTLPVGSCLTAAALTLPLLSWPVLPAPAPMPASTQRNEFPAQRNLVHQRDVLRGTHQLPTPGRR